MGKTGKFFMTDQSLGVCQSVFRQSRSVLGVFRSVLCENTKPDLSRVLVKRNFVHLKRSFALPDRPFEHPNLALALALALRG